MLPGYYDNAGVYHDPRDDYDPEANAQTTSATPTPPAKGITPFNGTFSPPPMLGMPTLGSMGDAPSPDLPTFQAPQAFRAPSVDEALSDPSYVFRRNQGQGVLERSAAAKGVLNDSGTAHELIDYGQNAASQEYQNIWNRDYNAYNTNYQTQYVDPYKFGTQRALDMNAPRTATWMEGNVNNRARYAAEVAWNQSQNETSWQHAYQEFLTRYQQWVEQNFTIPFAIAQGE